MEILLFKVISFKNKEQRTFFLFFFITFYSTPTCHTALCNIVYCFILLLLFTTPYLIFHFFISALGTRTPSSVKISRQDYELNSFPEKLLTVSNNEGMFMIEEEERKNKKNVSLNIENKDVENKLKNEKVNLKKEYSLKDCVLSQSTMVMWGYPTPPPSTTSFSTSSSNTTSLPSFSTTNPTLPISISSSSLSTSFTTVSLNSESVPMVNSLLSLPSPPLSSSSSLGNVPNSVEKRIREEDSSVSYDDVVLKKMRKECSLGSVEEGSHGTFLGGSSERQKEKMKDHQKLESIGEEISSTANNDGNNKSENNNGKEKVEIVNENEDVGVAIVLSNKGEETTSEKNTSKHNTVEGSTIEGRTGTCIGTSEKEGENDNNESSKNEHNNDISDLPAVGSRVGSVPTEKEAREIFNMKRIDSEHMNNLNVNNKKNGNDNDDGNGSVKQRDGNGGDVIPSMLVFPAYTVSMQMTRGGPNTGPGVSAFRSTVSKTSRDFNCLWTPSSSSDCAATTRTLNFSCHDTPSLLDQPIMSYCYIDVLHALAYCLPHLPISLTSNPPPPLSPIHLVSTHFFPFPSTLPLLPSYPRLLLTYCSSYILSPPSLSFTPSPFPSLVSLLIHQSSLPPFSLLLSSILPSYHSNFLPPLPSLPFLLLYYSPFLPLPSPFPPLPFLSPCTAHLFFSISSHLSHSTYNSSSGL